MLTYIKYLLTDAVICHWHYPSFRRRRKARKKRDKYINRLEKELTKQKKHADTLHMTHYIPFLKQVYFAKMMAIITQPLPGYKSHELQGYLVNNKSAQVDPVKEVLQ